MDSCTELKDQIRELLERADQSQMKCIFIFIRSLLGTR